MTPFPPFPAIPARDCPTLQTARGASPDRPARARDGPAGPSLALAGPVWAGPPWLFGGSGGNGPEWPERAEKASKGRVLGPHEQIRPPGPSLVRRRRTGPPTGALSDTFLNAPNPAARRAAFPLFSAVFRPSRRAVHFYPTESKLFGDSSDPGVRF